jgi:hypothetical protein
MEATGEEPSAHVVPQGDPQHVYFQQASLQHSGVAGTPANAQTASEDQPFWRGNALVSMRTTDDSIVLPLPSNEWAAKEGDAQQLPPSSVALEHVSCAVVDAAASASRASTDVITATSVGVSAAGSAAAAAAASGTFPALLHPVMMAGQEQRFNTQAEEHERSPISHGMLMLSSTDTDTRGPDDAGAASSGLLLRAVTFMESAFGRTLTDAGYEDTPPASTGRGAETDGMFDQAETQ